MFKKDFLREEKNPPINKQKPFYRFSIILIYFVMPQLIWLGCLEMFISNTPVNTLAISFIKEKTVGIISTSGKFIKLPFIEKVTLYRAGLITLKEKINYQTQDNKEIELELDIGLTIDKAEYIILAQNYDTTEDFIDNVVKALIKEQVSKELGKFTEKEIRLNQLAIKKQLIENITTQLLKLNIRLEHFFISGLKNG